MPRVKLPEKTEREVCQINEWGKAERAKTPSAIPIRFPYCPLPPSVLYPGYFKTEVTISCLSSNRLMELEQCASWREFSLLICNITFELLNPIQNLWNAHSSSEWNAHSTYVTTTIIDLWSNSRLLSQPWQCTFDC